MENHRQIEEKAAAWLAKRDDAGWCEADELALKAWLDASTAHRISFLRLKAACQRIDRLKVLVAGGRRWPAVSCSSAFEHPAPAFSSSAAVEEPKSTGMRDPVKRTLNSYRYLAASVLFAILVVVAASWQGSRQTASAHETSIGLLEEVALRDGSTVTLNSNSRIRVEVSETRRGVELNRGEAFFEVTRDPRRPFVVATANERITAVGTKFSVRRDAANLAILVAEGRVRVERVDGVGARFPPVEVPAGSIARVSGAGILVEAKSLAEVEEFLSWRNGFVVFRKISLADAAAELNRYNKQQIVITDPAVASLRIGGTFRTTNVEGFIRLLEQGLPIRIKREGDTIILLGSG